MSGKPIDEAVRALLPAAWLPDCQGKQDYDSDLVALSCRYYPPNYDNQGRHSVSASIVFGEGQDAVARHNFYADTEAGAKGKAEQWAAEQVASLVSTLTAAQQQGQVVAIEGTDAEVLREFIRICREHKPVGQWPGERVCAAIERSMANERQFRFIAEADMAPEREPSMKDADRALSGPRRTAPPSAPVGVIGDAIQHLSKWLDLNECECEASHQCGRAEVERTRDQLRTLAQQPAAVDALPGNWEARAWGEQKESINKEWAEWVRENHAGAASAFRTCAKQLRDALATQHQEPKS